MKIKLLNWSHI